MLELKLFCSESKADIKPKSLFEPDTSSLSLSLDGGFSDTCSGDNNGLVPEGCSSVSSLEFGRESTRVHAGRFDEICSNYEKEKSREESSSVFSRLGSKLNVSEELTPGRLIATEEAFYSGSAKEQGPRRRVCSRFDLRYPGNVGSGRMELFSDAPLEHISSRTEFSVQTHSSESFEPSSSDFIERYSRVDPIYLKRTSRTGPRAYSTITSASSRPSFTTRELEVPLRASSTITSASFRPSFTTRELEVPLRASSTITSASSRPSFTTRELEVPLRASSTITSASFRPSFSARDLDAPLGASSPNFQFSGPPLRVSSSASVAPQTFLNPNWEWISYNQQQAVQPPTWRNPGSLNSSSPFYLMDQDLRQVMDQRRQRDPYFSRQEHQNPGFSRSEDITDFWDHGSVFKTGSHHRQVSQVKKEIWQIKISSSMRVELRRPPPAVYNCFKVNMPCPGIYFSYKVYNITGALAVPA